MLAEAVRFELTDDFSSTVFKTVAINRALPRFLYSHLMLIEPHICQGPDNNVCPLVLIKIVDGIGEV